MNENTNEALRCAICGAEVGEDLVHFDGEILCEDCFSANVVECRCCGELIWSDDNAGTESMPLCQNCYDRYYIVVQLLNQGDGLSAKELARTAEQLEGTFTMTILHERENAVSFIRGDNPLCIYHYPKFGIYVYASTEQILCRALKHFRKELGAPEKVPTFCGDILRINVDGTREKAEFDDRNLWFCPYAGWSHWAEPDNRFPLRSEPRGMDRDAEYLAELKSMASIFGYYPEDKDMLLEEGVTVDEIEELLYSGQF